MREKLLEIMRDISPSKMDVVTEDVFEDIGYDSVDKIELLVTVEERFDISIDDEVFSNFNCGQDILDHLRANV